MCVDPLQSTVMNLLDTRDGVEDARLRDGSCNAGKEDEGGFDHVVGLNH